MDKEAEFLDKDGKKVMTYGYVTERIYEKIDTGSDVIINSFSSHDLIVGKPISIDGKTVKIKTEHDVVSVKIEDILDIS